MKQWFVKWTLFTWFVVSNGFNLKAANKDAAQTLRKLKWDMEQED